MGTRIVNKKNNIYYCCDFFLTSAEYFLVAENYLFIYERILAVRIYIFHSTVTEGPTDYLKENKDDFFDHIYGLKFFKRADMYVCLCMSCK